MTTTEHQVPVVPLPRPELRPFVKGLAIRKSMRKWDTERIKDFFLKIYKVTGNLKTTIERVGIKSQTFYRWKKTDADFVQKLDIINVMWDDLLKQQVKNLNLKATRVLELILDMALEKDPTKNKINSSTVEVALKLLSSQGYISDRSTVEHTGEGGGPIRYTNTTEIKRSNPQPAIEA
ncbi:hypothetical protein LCGC14_2040920, partial [marine sediment metagenome]